MLFYIVLILVLVEYFVPLTRKWKTLRATVLILILVEYFVPLLLGQKGKVSESLNPCFSGILRTFSNLSIDMAVYCLNPYFSGILRTFSGIFRGIDDYHCLNPYFCGILRTVGQLGSIYRPEMS